MTEQDLAQRQRQFIAHLYQQAENLDSNTEYLARQARQCLAQLRRGVGKTYPAPAAYDLVLQHDPPPSQEEMWLLIAGLFALHPVDGRGDTPTLGAALGQLHGVGSTEARLRQLVTVNDDGLPHYLRQAVQLLSVHNIGLDYRRLLTDLCLLQHRRADEQTHQVRLRWMRDYYRVVHAANRTTSEKGNTA